MRLTDALNIKLDDIERPKLVPRGSYRCAVRGLPVQENISSPKGDWDKCEFTLSLVEPFDDVDPDELAEYGNVTGVTLRHSFLFDTQDKNKFDGSLFRLRTFLDQHLKCSNPSDDLGDAINNSPGAECLVTVDWRPDRQDKEQMFPNVKGTAAL